MSNTDINEYFSAVFPDKEKRIEYLNLFRSIFIKKVGDTISEQSQPPLIIWIGPGSNGKSTFFHLLKQAMQDMVGEVSINLLQVPFNLKVASPVVFALKNKAMVIVEDTEGEILRADSLLQFSGCSNVTLPLRRLHEDEKPVKLNFITVLICNKLPNIDNEDMMKKAYIMRFTNTFKYDATKPFVYDDKFVQSFRNKICSD